MAVTVLLGAPGSGKGTQAKHLAQKGNFQHLSTGDMLRAAIQRKTPVGNKAQSYVSRGELVPDEIMIDLIKETLGQTRGDSDVLLDGFPRTVAQAKALDQSPNTKAQLAIYFEIPEEVLVERLTGRRICERDGTPYHIKFNPAKQANRCDICGGNLIQRADDTEEVVRRRLSVFRKTNEELLQYYRKLNNLTTLNANQPIETLQKQMNKILNEWYT